MGQVGEGRVLVEDHSLWRALLAAGAERICCALPCRTESSREVQRPVVPSGHTNASSGACAMSREAGWAPKLLPSRGGLVGGRASDQHFEHWAMAGSTEASHYYSKPGFVIKWG